MPGGLDHINLYLLEDQDGWTIVDTCLKLDSAKILWESLFNGFMKGKPVIRVICTHLHPDHIGLAGWLCARFECDLWMTRSEFLHGNLLLGYTAENLPQEAIDFYFRAGFDEQTLETYRKRFGTFGRMAEKLPHRFRRLRDRDTLTIGKHYWQVVVGSGHSPEHACLYCPGLKLIIAGDQILPRITPNVSVFPTEPEGNPLDDWLTTNSKIMEILPSDLLVLPAHQSPFIGVKVRISQLIDGHRQSLSLLYDALADRKTVPECFDILFKRKIGGSQIQMATGETIAHLNYLIQRGNVTRGTNSIGQYVYQADPNSRFLKSND